MAKGKMTQEKVAEMDNGCKNGFCFDREYYIDTGKTRLHHVIHIDENKQIEAILHFTENYSSGSKILYPKLYVQTWNRSGTTEVWVSSGARGNAKEYKEHIVPRRNIKKLQEITGEITEVMILEMAGVKKAVELQE